MDDRMGVLQGERRRWVEGNTMARVAQRDKWRKGLKFDESKIVALNLNFNTRACKSSTPLSSRYIVCNERPFHTSSCPAASHGKHLSQRDSKVTVCSQAGPNFLQAVPGSVTMPGERNENNYLKKS
jgi:hypothetical protein